MRDSKLYLQTIFAICRPPPRSSIVHGYRAMVKHDYHQSNSEKRLKKSKAAANDGSENEVLFTDVKNMLNKVRKLVLLESDSPKAVEEAAKYQSSQPERYTEIELEISELSSTGDGLGFSKPQDHVYVVPFSVPGDVVLAKTVKKFPLYTMTDFIKVTKSGSSRNDSLSKCPYFAKCAGCQLQMLPYDVQLAHKKSIVEKAYQNFSALTPEVIPAVSETIGSPMQYGYRTKLTPHFDGPPGAMSRSWRKDPSKRKGLAEVPPIGFQEKGRGRTIDIEDCPIGTDIVREGMQRERKRIAGEFAKFTKGATILLRESTLRKPVLDGKAKGVEAEPPERVVAHESQLKQEEKQSAQESSGGASNGSLHSYLETKSCITDQRAESTEYVDWYIFKNTAGAFFQNNNSILPNFTAYIRDHIIPPNPSQTPIKYLIDAYCGSGLFTITLSTLFTSSLGIDIAGDSVTAARENAKLNNIDNAKFITADAAQLFKEVEFPTNETAVVIDPPRKGCDDAFLKQLLRFGPKRVVYVSCNVHTQARDVGILVEGVGECRYEIETLQGFDFFPQTGHVEGVAVLARNGS